MKNINEFMFSQNIEYILKASLEYASGSFIREERARELVIIMPTNQKFIKVMHENYNMKYYRSYVLYNVNKFYSDPKLTYGTLNVSELFVNPFAFVYCLEQRFGVKCGVFDIDMMTFIGKLNHYNDEYVRM